MKVYKIFRINFNGDVEMTPITPRNPEGTSLGFEFPTKEAAEAAIEEASAYTIQDGKLSPLREKGHVNLTIMEVYK